MNGPKALVTAILVTALAAGGGILWMRAKENGRKEAVPNEPIASLPTLATGRAQASGKELPARRSWGQKADERKREFLELLNRRDLRAASIAGEKMVSEASPEGRLAAQAFIDRALADAASRLVEDRHAPRYQKYEVAEIREMTSGAAADPARREEVVRDLLKSRLPDDTLPDVLKLIRESLLSSPQDTSCIGLLNCFAGDASKQELAGLVDGSNSKDVRLEALRQLNVRQRTTDDVAMFQKACASEGDPDIRASMILMISAVKGPETEPLFLQALSDTSPQVRSAAVSGLDPSRPAGNQALIGLVASDPDGAVRASALRQLNGQLTTPGAFQSVLPIIASDPVEEVRLMGIMTLGRSGNASPEILATLQQMTSSDSAEEVRNMARSTLLRLKAGAK